MRPLNFLWAAALVALAGLNAGPVPASEGLPGVGVGQPAPDITIPADQAAKVLPGHKVDGPVRLKDLRGRNVVLFFIPPATVPSSAEQCRGFRDRLPEFAKLDTVALGISTDGSKALEKFTQEEHLTFSLYADHNWEIGGAYHVIGSRGYAQRTTFVIDKEGIVRKVDREPNARDNPGEVLRYVEEHLAGQ